uniref:Uncharacterized protein n=2 Tax=Anguilla anguilla TaxID=7936 RepID=A0A0E9RUS1_ANGAN
MHKEQHDILPYRSVSTGRVKII